MTRKIAFFGLLGGLLILFGAGVVVSRKVGKTGQKPAKPPTKPADHNAAEVRRELEAEIQRAGQVINAGRDLERRYPPVRSEEY